MELDVSRFPGYLSLVIQASGDFPEDSLDFSGIADAVVILEGENIREFAQRFKESGFVVKVEMKPRPRIVWDLVSRGLVDLVSFQIGKGFDIPALEDSLKYSRGISEVVYHVSGDDDLDILRRISEVVGRYDSRLVLSDISRETPAPGYLESLAREIPGAWIWSRVLGYYPVSP